LKTKRLVALLWVVGIPWLIPAGTATAATVDTNPMNYDPQVRAAYTSFYNLDFSDAVADFQRFHQQHPGNAQATAYLLDALIFQELYRLDLLDTTFYANDGFLTGKHAIEEDQGKRNQIFSLADEAVHEADWALSKNPNDVNALFARAWVRALRCTYVAMVERSFGAGFHLATKAKDDAQRVLQIDPNYVDAKLITGVYEYVVGALPWPFKLMIGFAGITGSKSTGLAMLWDAGNRGVITSMEARTAIALFLRREGKYKEAIKVVQGLERQYPRDYLFSLEEANLRKDDGEGMAAVDAYRQVLAETAKPDFFASAKPELAYFGLADALRGQRHYDEAALAYEHAAAAHEVGAELKIRSLLDAGECHDLTGMREQAVHDYQAAIDAGPATSRADQARKYLHSPYRGS
jgi:tetratricopeptide (TPR) repeat protein